MSEHAENVSQWEPAGAPEEARYVVKAGDSLSTIASDLLGDVNEWVDIARFNGISSPYVLEIGQVLTIPREVPPKAGTLASGAELIPDRQNACDLLRNPSGTLLLIDQWKAGKFIAENPSFSIVGIGLSRGTTDTPYGKIGAVLE